MIKSIIIGLISFCLIISCKDSKRNDPITSAETKNYSEIEIYCFCFLSEDRAENKNQSHRTSTRMCTTPFRFTPAMLIGPNYLLYKTSDSVVINSIANMMFDNLQLKKTGPGIEPRFLLLFKKNYFSADTAFYIDNKSFYHNNGELFEYSFNVLDSIKKVIKIGKIDCD